MNGWEKTADGWQITARFENPVCRMKFPYQIFVPGMHFLIKFDHCLSQNEMTEILRVFEIKDHLTMREKKIYIALKFGGSQF